MTARPPARAGECVEPRFEAIFQAEPECVKVLDSKGRILEMNPAGLGILEARSASEVIGRSMWDFVVPSQHEQVLTCFGKVMKRESVTCAFEVVGVQGGRRWLESHMVAMGDRTEAIEVLAVTRDVTKARMAEEAMRESEERFRLIVENCNDLIAELTLDGKFLYASPAFKSTLGYEPEGLLRKRAFDLVHPDDSSTLRQLLDEAGPSAVYRYRHQNGSWRWMESSGRRYRSSEGEDRAVIIARDVTQRMEAEAAQAMMEAKLQQTQKMEALGTLAGGIAHDFNNILVAIIGNVELARMELGPENPVAPHLSETLKAANRATDLVRQILTFSRRKDHERKVIHITPILSEVAKLLRAALPANVEIRAKMGRALPAIFADASQIHQVMMNLATNAAYAMKDTDGVLEMELTDEIVTEEGAPKLAGLNPGRFLKITISDNGVGMTPEVMARIFEPFFTTKPVGEGTGLGLSVVHGIVKAQDGAIFVSSEAGRGSRFDIYLPAVEQGTATPAKDTKFRGGHGEGVLYVDDEVALCRLVASTLERCGYRAKTVNDPEEALQVFQNRLGEFSAVITDFTMPKMTGLEFAEAIKRISPQTPVILTTGFTGNLSVDSLKSCGVDEVLPKPFGTNALAECLRRVITAA